MTAAPEIKPSATLILLRQTAQGMETLLLKRHQAMAFGSAWVFPGGKIDPQDYHRLEASRFHDDEEVAAAYHAAVRETREEAGLDMQPQELVLMSCWTTPVLGDRPRFRTWFFVGEIGDQPVVVDGHEMTDYRWINTQEAVTQQNVRELNMLPPTFNTLIDINCYPDVKTTLAALRKKPIQVYNPKLLPMEGGYVSLYEGDAGFEVGDVHAEGPRHRMIVDVEGYRLEKTINGLE